MPNLILCLNLLSTWYMVGLIWMVQIVHYPLFAKVSTENYVQYQQLHERYITPVVGLPMMIEIITAILLLNFLPKGVSSVWIWFALILLIVIWLSTAFLQVPCHSKLSIAFDSEAHRRLVNTNWIRTVCWTLRGALVAWFVFGARATN